MANPILNDKFLEARENLLDNHVMTVNGAIQNTFVLGIIAVFFAYVTWTRFIAGHQDMAMALTTGGAIVGFILALIISFTRNKILIPMYAVAEGLTLGGVSAIFETMYPGIVMQAVLGTFAALFSMLFLYRANVIKCSDKFRSVIFISTASIAVIYLVDFIGRFFHYAVPVINSSSNLGIGFSLIVVVIAALNLIIDFDFIEKGAQAGLPKDYEWYGAFGLMVTLVWLYLEILRLLAKMSNRR